MPEPFLERIDRGVLVGDGAMGTELYARGIDITACFDALNVRAPDLVSDVHRAYAAAGADVIETNTFGANRVRLAQFGLEDQVRAFNVEGVRLARRAAGSRAYVAGSVGPIEGRWGEESPTPETVRDVFREQIRALAEAGADLLVFETFSNLQHLLEGIRVAREETRLPIVCQMAFLEAGRTASGVSDVTAAKELAAAGADVVGANCVSGPIRTLEVIARMARACAARLSAYPNAGAPTFVNGRYIYASTPEYVAEYAARMVAAGVALVGGCCGTTPADIRAIVTRLADDRALRPRPTPVSFPAEPPSGPSREAPPRAAPRFLADLSRRRFVTVELDPPKGTDYRPVLAAAKALAREGGVDAFNLAENTMGTPRLSNVALAHILQQETGIEVLVHLTCRDRNLIGLQSELLGAWALGLRHVLALTGDPAKIGPQPGATSVYDTQSFGLVDLVSKLNAGVNAIGNAIGEPTGFSIGVAFDPNGKKMEPQVNRLRKKIRLGAQYALTQPVYTAAKAEEMYDKTADVGVPIILGVMPLVGERNAEYLHNEVPGIRIPDEVRAQMRGLSGIAGKAKGLELARRLVEEVFRRAPGFYIIPMFNNVEIALEIVRHVRALESKAWAAGPGGGGAR